jgi:carbonic anhydrase
VANDDVFADVTAANAAYASEFSLAGLAPRAAKNLAIVTCMDSRIEPLTMLGLAPGDAKILRNAGARVTDDVVRTLLLARYLLGVERVMVVAHTNCRMAGGTEDDVRAAITAAGGPDTSELSFLVATDQLAALRSDVARAQASAYLKDTVIGGFLYDVETGLLSRIC